MLQYKKVVLRSILYIGTQTYIGTQELVIHIPQLDNQKPFYNR